MLKINGLLGLYIIVSIIGCSSTPKTDFRDRMLISQSLFGDIHDFFYIPSQGSLSDHLFVRQSHRSPEEPSMDARRLVDRFKISSNKLLRIAVSGPSSVKTQTILLEACELLKGNQLPHLTLAFIGHPRHSPKIEKCFSPLKITYILSPYPDSEES